MHPTVQPLVDALDALDEALAALVPGEARSMLEMYGWNFPALDRTDLQYLVSELHDLVVARAPDTDSGENIAEMTKRVTLIQTTIVPHLFNGNGATAAQNIVVSLRGIHAWVEAAWPATEKVDPNELPGKLARQARYAKTRLDNATGDLAEIEKKLKLILDAHAAADALPTDLEELKQIRASLLTATTQTATDREAVSSARFDAEAALKKIEESGRAADVLIAKCEDAYQITTTKGLSAAFAQRALTLGITVWVWVIGLLIALFSVAFLGHDRIAALTALISEDPKWGVIVLNLVLSALSVGAPLWFAWVATKQIGQRFRLAEDYGFKASVAKAYEGYRREAARIDANVDEKFEAQLFSIALSRLEEAPLRMVENESHGSPYHELLSNVRKDRSFLPDLRNMVSAWRRRKEPAQESPDKEASE